MIRFERHNHLEFGPGTELGTRLFRTFDLVFVHDGRADLEIGEQRLSLNKRGAVLIYPHTLIKQSSAGMSRTSGLHFSLEPDAAKLGLSFARLVGKENGFEVAPRPFSEKEEWDVLRALQMATLEQTRLTYEIRIAQLVMILAQWQPKPMTIHAGPRHAREFRQLVEWLEANLDKPITSDEMARKVGLSSSQFRQHFKEMIGSSPVQFFLDMRMDACKRLLLESDLGIKSVAQAVGYSDLPHFYRNFKKHTGKTPDQFRHDLLSEAVAVP